MTKFEGHVLTTKKSYHKSNQEVWHGDLVTKFKVWHDLSALTQAI